ncbi:MAG: peptidoglycan-binding protein [Lachnospiraceae bacterium]|nr:peptidoglycan-binding protein [Lachnospiraceae bacterium]
MIKKSSKFLNAILSIALSAIIMVISATPAFALTYSGSSSYKSGPYYTNLTKVNLTGNKKTDIVNIAKSQVGYHEGNNSSQLSGTSNGDKNYTEYGRWYGMQDQWCAMFVSWCANLAGVSTSVIPKHASTVAGLQKFKDWGRAYSRADVAAGKYAPKAGDIIYFKSSDTSAATNHVGIVINYSDSTVYTIEGNKGNKVTECSYAISNTYIVYICSPNYNNSATDVSYPTLKEGSQGYRVKALQYMLNYHVNAGLTVDGIFGTGTKNAVIKFQNAKGLSADGIVGTNTWTKLTGVNQSTSSYNENLTKAIQVLLNSKISAGLTVDGKFGTGTKEAVVNFQKSKGLSQDGIVGVNTWKYLLS